MRRFMRVQMAAVALCAMVSMAPEAVAQESQTAKDLMMVKLGRGLANIVTGWMELGNQPHQEYVVNGTGRALTVGVLKGIGFAVARTVAGVYEVVSFPIPMPENYRPVIHPPLLFAD